MKAIWNNVRAIDLLESLPEVDPDAIGCVGHSLGGHNGLFTAAFDTRIVVYQGALNCPTAATAVYACNDDSAGCGALTSSVSFETTDTQQYWVRIGSKANVGGAGTVTFTCVPSAPPCPADFDGNGSVDGGDLAALLGSWGTCAGCAADIDGNGAIDAGDLAELLGSWGPCQ